MLASRRNRTPTFCQSPSRGLLRARAGKGSAFTMPQHAPRKSAGVIAVGYHDFAVHQQPMDSLRELMGLIKGGPFSDGLGVEDDNVCLVAGLQLTTVGDAETFGRQRGHLSDCIRQRERLGLAHILSEHAGIGAIGARMRM